VNVHCPAGARFSISDFRIFGNGLGRSPAAVQSVIAGRNPADARKTTVTWSPSERAEFYIVRYGLAPDRLFNNYQIYNATNAQINSLNSGTVYYCTMDAINDSGVTPAKTVFRLNP
jgi:hypothetical protein